MVNKNVKATNGSNEKVAEVNVSYEKVAEVNGSIEENTYNGTGAKRRSFKKKVTFAAGLLLGVCLIIVINYIPTFSLKTGNMTVLEGKWANICYENEKAAAEDVFNTVDSGAERIARLLGFEEKPDVNVYIYDKQSKMQQKKYGLLGPMLNLDWYIGDNIGTDVILTSPACEVEGHTYNSIKDAVLHELTHAYISVMNPKIALWLTEGTALYLTNGPDISSIEIERIELPTYADTETSNPITFANCGGYMLAGSYIEFLEKTYGWDKVVELLKTENYMDIFGKTSEEIYFEWIDYLTNPRF